MRNQSNAFKHFFHRAAIVLSLVCLSSTAAATGEHQFETVYVFGDSLSDTGNVLVGSGNEVPFPLFYNAGRWSNGPVWSDYLTKALVGSPDGTDFALPASLLFFFASGQTTTCPMAGASCSYAFGGSGTQDSETPTGLSPGLLSQIGMFEAELPPSGTADPKALYVIWSGANNYLFPAFNQIFGPLFGPLLAPDKPKAVVADIAHAIEELTRLGAEKFLVVNLPDLGTAPLAAPVLGPIVEPAIRKNLTKQTLKHNRRLARAISKLNRKPPENGREILLLDAYTLFELELSAPGSNEAGPASGCLLPPFYGTPSCDPAFPPDFEASLTTKIWDEQHPTTELHEALAQRALRILKDFNRH